MSRVDGLVPMTHTVKTLRDRISADRWAQPRTVSKPVERIECADGFSVSVQAGANHYCTPREHSEPKTFRLRWDTVAVGFPSAPIPEFRPWRDWLVEGQLDENSVFGYVPIEKVVELINSHGGEMVHPAWVDS